MGLPAWLLAASLLGVLALAGALTLDGPPLDGDEARTLAAGVSYLERGDLRLDAQQPPLGKLWPALPVWLGAERRLDYDTEAWTGHGILPGTTLSTGADAEQAGRQLLGFPGNGPVESTSPLITARRAQLVLGLLLGLMVYGWALELWGPRGALLALFLYCLSPSMLAAARLATPDLPAAVAVTGTLWAFWRFTQRPDLIRGLFVGLALAAALLTRLWLVMMIPALLLVALAWLWVPRLERWERYGRGQLVALVLLGALLIGYGGVWAGYGFRYQAVPDDEYQLDWDAAALPEGPLRRAVYGALDRELLPQGYLYGVSHALAQARLAPTGAARWFDLPLAFVLRTPPALLLLLLLVAGGVAARRQRRRSFDTWCLLLPVLLLSAVSMVAMRSVGPRALVPVYPLLFILAGQLAWFVRQVEAEPEEPDPDQAAAAARPGWLVWGLTALLAAYAVSFVAATPGQRPYANLLAPGESAPPDTGSAAAGSGRAAVGGTPR